MPSHRGRRPVTFADRFWAKVDKTPDCWLWTRCRTRCGYGQVWHDGKMRMAHRVAYEMLVGPIPAGEQIDHICYVHNCVNPDHMQSVTGQKNRENLPGAYSNSRSGIRGVAWSRGAWRVRVRVKGRLHSGGAFASASEAERAAIGLRNRLMTNNLADRQSVA